MIYFDNAATTFPKPRSVIDSVMDCIENYCGNPSRSSHPLSMMAADAVFDARCAVAELLSIDTPESVVFTENATYALNMAIKTALPEKCHVITSDIEHNSVIRPLERLRYTRGIEYSLFDSDENIYESIPALIRSNTKAIVCTLMSNVTGKMTDLAALSEIARRYSLILIVDASQMIGHESIDLSKTPCDILCAPGHKALFGIQGCGFAVFKEKTVKETFIEGGSGNDSINPEMPAGLPEHFEAGTLPTPSIVALKSGIDFINNYGMSNVTKRLHSLEERCAEILSSFAGIKVYGKGPISFSYKDVPSSHVCERLNKDGIYTRCGLHCAPSAHRKAGTLTTGLTRISLSVFNTEDELDKLYLSLKDITNTL